LLLPRRGAENLLLAGGGGGGNILEIWFDDNDFSGVTGTL